MAAHSLWWVDSFLMPLYPHQLRQEPMSRLHLVNSGRWVLSPVPLEPIFPAFLHLEQQPPRPSILTRRESRPTATRLVELLTRFPRALSSHHQSLFASTCPRLVIRSPSQT